VAARHDELVRLVIFLTGERLSEGEEETKTAGFPESGSELTKSRMGLVLLYTGGGRHENRRAYRFFEIETEYSEI
jgi:hypothetical protein